MVALQTILDCGATNYFEFVVFIVFVLLCHRCIIHRLKCRSLYLCYLIVSKWLTIRAFVHLLLMSVIRRFFLLWRSPGQWLIIWMHCYCSYGLCVLIILLTANVLYGCFECLSDTLPLIICIIKWRDYVLMLYLLSYGLCVLIILRTANVLCDCFECLSATLALIICIIKRRDYVLPG